MSDFKIFYEDESGGPGGEFLACSWCGKPFQLEWQTIFYFVATTDEEELDGCSVRVKFDFCEDCARALKTNMKTFFSEEIGGDGEDDGDGEDLGSG